MKVPVKFNLRTTILSLRTSGLLRPECDQNIIFAITDGKACTGPSVGYVRLYLWDPRLVLTSVTYDKTASIRFTSLLL